MENKSRELEVAIRAAMEAGKILEKYFETEILKETKEDTSITTLADKESEDLIKKIILEAFPDHSVLGEETGMTENGGEYVWHIDPIDGTRNFANGIPLFAVSIALTRGADLLVGVVHNPNLNALFYAEAGKGAYWNDQRMSVSSDDAKHGIVTVASGKKEDDIKLRRALMHDLPSGVVSAVRDFGCTALDLAYVARGNTEADIKFGLRTYDFTAGLLLVIEAGGKITDIAGAPWKMPESSYIASNGLFHDKLVEEVKRQKQNLNL